MQEKLRIPIRMNRTGKTRVYLCHFIDKASNTTNFFCHKLKCIISFFLFFSASITTTAVAVAVAVAVGVGVKKECRILN